MREIVLVVSMLRQRQYSLLKSALLFLSERHIPAEVMARPSFRPELHTDEVDIVTDADYEEIRQFVAQSPRFVTGNKDDWTPTVQGPQTPGPPAWREFFAFFLVFRQRQNACHALAFKERQKVHD